MNNIIPINLLKHHLRRNIWIYKKQLRRSTNTLDRVNNSMRLLKRSRMRLEGSKFNSHRISQFDEEIESCYSLRSEIFGLRKEISLGLSQLMRAYDHYESTDHELAQILNVSHVAYDKFLEKNPEAKGSLHTSAFLHAETFTEREAFIGERGTRDHPLFTATHCALMDLMDKNAEFRAETTKIMDEVLGPIPRYQKGFAADGTVSFERLPPKLHVVKDEE